MPGLPATACVSWLAALALLSLGACQCDRSSALHQKYGELELVTRTIDGDELLSRDTSVTMERVPMGATGSVSVTVRNVGSASLTLTHLAQLEGDVGFAAELPADAVLRPSEDFTLTVGFTAEQAADATLPSVPHQAKFELQVEGARPGEESALLTVHATATAKDCFLPATVDFGLAPPGLRVAIDVDLSNATPGAVTATVGALSGDDALAFDAAPTGAVPVAAGGAQALTLGFTATEARAYAATLTARRGATCPEGTVRLLGQGSADAVAWAPSSLDLGRVPVGDRVTQHVRVTNRSGASLAITGVAVTGAGFLAGPKVPATVPPRGTADVEVTCAPGPLGRFGGELDFQLGTVPPQPVRIPLSCGGGGPKIQVRPTALQFGVVPYVSTGSPTTTLTLHVQNVGTPPIPGDPEENLHLGHHGQPPYVQVLPTTSGTAPSEFLVTIPRTYDPVTGLEAVAGRNDLALEVRFTPSSSGSKAAVLLLASDDASHPDVSIPLAAHANVGGACVLTVNQTQLAFGDLPPGASVEGAVVLTNAAASGTSGATCLLSGLGFVAGSDPAYSLLAPAQSWASLNPGQSLVARVRLAMPSGQVRGTVLTGFLRVTTSSPSLPQLVVPLTARSVECLAVTPGLIAFGAQRPGCRTDSHTVTIYNQCSTPVTLTQSTLAGADFVVTKGPAVGAGGLAVQGGAAPLTFDLAFAPSSVGFSQGSFRLDFLEADGGRTSTVALSGLGDDAGVAVDTFDIPQKPLADILFVVDDSCSMTDKQASLATNFSSFMQEAQTFNVDYHLGVTTTDDSTTGERGRLLSGPSNPTVLTPQSPNVAALFSQKAQVGTLGTGFETPVDCAIEALTPPLITAENAGFLRPAASLAVVVVSDANDQSPTPISFALSRLLGVKGADQSWLFSFNVVGPFTPPPLPVGCTIDSVPDDGRYKTLIDATHGASFDVCSTNWAAGLGQVGKTVFGLKSAFPLSSPPQGGTLPQVRINGVPVAGWSWDAVTNTVVFSPSSLPPAGSKVAITYTPACF